ncbi:hypothetical protein HRbin40_01425 [bacterium HR40]|nr:hypothetical protein HRbin40_01425 [bacterium HR40]
MGSAFLRLREPALALATGLLGGLAGNGFGLPLGWLLGAMFATAAAAVAGLEPMVPNVLRRAVITVLGLLIGGSFEAHRLAGLHLWLPSLALLAAYVLLVGAMSLWYLRRWAGLRPYTAFFAAAPGGLSEMVMLSDRMGADMRAVALVHATRVLLIVSLAPLFVGTLGGGPAPPGAGAMPLPGDLAILAAAGLAGAFAARFLSLPAAELLGPMVLSAGLHLSGVVTADVPYAVVVFAQITIGAAIGSRFRDLGWARIVHHLFAGLGLTALMFALTLVFALLLHRTTGLPFLALVLAYMPGGVVEMSTVALALAVDPAFVATHHAVRIALVVLLAPLLFPLWRRWQQPSRES